MSILEIQRLTKNYEKFTAVSDLDLSVEKGEFLVILGPSGCGKTTTMRCIAGLERADPPSRISIDGRPVSDPTNGLHVAPEKRKIGMVFQSYAIWPHMTVAENVAFGLKIQGWKQPERDEQLKRVLDAVGLTDQASKSASLLSGGQMQRVALARALVTSPALILFDEPLSNLDLKLREHLRVELLRIQRQMSITSIYVTHDQTEALALGDRIVVMNRGKIVQIGTPEDIYLRPRSRFVADFIGSPNVFRVSVAEHRSHNGVIGLLGGHPVLGTTTGDISVEEAFVAVRPENIRVFPRTQDLDKGTESRWPGVVAEVTFMGSYARAVVNALDEEWFVNVPVGVVKHGDTVWMEVDAQCVQFLPE